METNFPTQAQASLRGPIVQTATGLKPPEEVITSLSAARTLFLQLRTDQLPRTAFAASLDGLLAGNPPFDQGLLDASGLAYIANFNNLDARSLYERTAIAYWNLLNQTVNLAVFYLESAKYPPQKLRQWEQILAKNFTKVVRKWRAFNTQTCTNMAQIAKLGVSCVLWPDERDWRPTTIEYSRFYVPNQAQVNMDKLTFLFLESIFTVQELYTSYAFTQEFPKESNWQLKPLEEYLVARANSWLKPERPIIDMADIQSRITNGELNWGQIFTDNVTLISLLYLEYDEKVSHYIFDPFAYSTLDFLLKSHGQYESMNEAIVIFTASPGEFQIHANRGVGHKIYAGSQAVMQLDCAIVDAARWASTPIISSPPGQTNSLDGIRFIQGVPTDIGGAVLQQNNIGANVQYLVSVSQYITGKMEKNIANGGDDPTTSDPDTGSKSPTQLRQQAFREFGVQKNNMAHFYESQDCVIANMVNRMVKSKKNYPGYKFAKWWKDQSIKEGVPPDIFDVRESDKTPWGTYSNLEACASRVAGDGSQLGLITMLQEMAPIVGELSSEGAREYATMWVIATFGPRYVDSFLPPSDEQDAKNNGASLAGTENAIMQLGYQPIFSQDNDQRAHIATHFPLAQQIVQQVQQQQMSPIDADKQFAVIIPHLGEHMQALSKMPTAQETFQQILPLWKQIQKYAQNNRQNAEKMIQAQIRQKQEAEQATNQVMGDAQRKDFVAQADVKRADAKVGSQIERAKEASDTRAKIMEQDVQNKADNKRLEIQLNPKPQTPAPPPSESIDTESLPELHSDLSSMLGSTPSNYDFE
jgi:hypothetical protein